MLLWLFSTAAIGQEAKPSGTVTIHQVQVAFIGSGTSGSGTLQFRLEDFNG
jgi:hypothetical protein